VKESKSPLMTVIAVFGVRDETQQALNTHTNNTSTIQKYHLILFIIRIFLVCRSAEICTCTQRKTRRFSGPMIWREGTQKTQGGPVVHLRFAMIR
jgi:hypothetical protein